MRPQTDFADNPRLIYLLSALIPVGFLAPWIAKPFHLDDPMFLWLAHHLLENPVDFYGFDVHWHETWQPMHEINMNPPGVGYFLALAGLFVGWSEPALHTVFLLPAIAAATGAAFLARQWQIPALPAVFATVATPAFLVSGTTIMSDLPFLAIYIWAIALWVRGDDTGRMRWLIAATFLAACGVLVKYLVITALPLMALYTIVSSRKPLRILWLLVPLAVLTAYHFLTLRMYGHSLVFGATGYATGHAPPTLAESGMKLLVALAFLGGCFIGVACFALVSMRPRHALIALATFIAVALLLLIIGRIDFRLIRLETGIRWTLLFQAAMMITAGLYLLWFPAAQLARRRDPINLVLACWLIGIVVFVAFLNWTINARVLLAAAPAAGLLTARALPSLPATRSSTLSSLLATRYWLLAIIAATILALIPAYLDYRLAQAHRDAARYIARELQLDPATTRFQGHWGFQHYMMQAGYKPYDTGEGLTAGEHIVTMHNSPSVVPLPEEIADHVATFAVPNARFGATMSREVGAGFYSHFWGPLPYIFADTPPEAFTLVRIRLPN